MKHKKQILMLTIKFTENGRQYNYLYKGNRNVKPGMLARVKTKYHNYIDLPILAVGQAILKPGICYKFVSIVNSFVEV